MEQIDHAATAHLDTPKERALRNAYEDADFEVQQLKHKLKRMRMTPVSEEYEAAAYWRERCLLIERVLIDAGLGHHVPQRDRV